MPLFQIMRLRFRSNLEFDQSYKVKYIGQAMYLDSLILKPLFCSQIYNVTLMHHNRCSADSWYLRNPSESTQG